MLCYNRQTKNTSIDVFGYEDETPYRIYTSKQTFEKHVDLLLLSDCKNSHFVLITDFNRFMTNKTKHHSKKHFCPYCLQCFCTSRVLESDVKNCLAINHTKPVLLPEENVSVNFQNFKRLTKAPFIIYGDFECVLIPSIDNIYFGTNTKKYHDHTVCSLC